VVGQGNAEQPSGVFGSEWRLRTYRSGHRSRGNVGPTRRRQIRQLPCWSPDTATAHRTNGQVNAEGRVRNPKARNGLVGEHVSYNFMTKKMEARRFGRARLRCSPVGRALGRQEYRFLYANHAISHDARLSNQFKGRGEATPVFTVRQNNSLAHSTTLAHRRRAGVFISHTIRCGSMPPRRRSFTAGVNRRPVRVYVLGANDWKWGECLGS